MHKHIGCAERERESKLTLKEYIKTGCLLKRGVPFNVQHINESVFADQFDTGPRD